MVRKVAPFLVLIFLAAGAFADDFVKTFNRTGGVPLRWSRLFDSITWRCRGTRRRRSDAAARSGRQRLHEPGAKHGPVDPVRLADDPACHVRVAAAEADSQQRVLDEVRRA